MAKGEAARSAPMEGVTTIQLGVRDALRAKAFAWMKANPTFMEGDEGTGRRPAALGNRVRSVAVEYSEPKVRELLPSGVMTTFGRAWLVWIEPPVWRIEGQANEVITSFEAEVPL